MVYAIIRSGGKQYRVEKEGLVDVEIIEGEPGSIVEFPEVLFVNDGQNAHFGSPHVKNFFVKGEIVGEIGGPKITSIKYKIRKNERRKWGHRQHYTRIKIVDIASLHDKKHHDKHEPEHEKVEEKQPKEKKTTKAKKTKEQGE